MQNYEFSLCLARDLSYSWIGISLFLLFLSEFGVDLQHSGDDIGE